MDKVPVDGEHVITERRHTGFRVKLVPEISIADILTIIMIGGPVMIWAGRMDTRIDLIEKRVVEQKVVDEKQDYAQAQLRTEIREELRIMNSMLITISERVAKHDGETNARSVSNGRK